MNHKFSNATLNVIYHQQFSNSISAFLHTICCFFGSFIQEIQQLFGYIVLKKESFLFRNLSLFFISLFFGRFNIRVELKILLGSIARQLLLIIGVWLTHLSFLSASDIDFQNYYTDEDIHTSINAMIVSSQDIERTPDSIYLLKPKKMGVTTFCSQDGHSYYAALLPICSCLDKIQEEGRSASSVFLSYFLSR